MFPLPADDGYGGLRMPLVKLAFGNDITPTKKKPRSSLLMPLLGAGALGLGAYSVLGGPHVPKTTEVQPPPPTTTPATNGNTPTTNTTATPESSNWLNKALPIGANIGTNVAVNTAANRGWQAAASKIPWLGSTAVKAAPSTGLIARGATGLRSLAGGLPGSVALGTANLFGVNPLDGERGWNPGLPSHEEALNIAENRADAPAWKRVLDSSDVVTPMYYGSVLGQQAAKDQTSAWQSGKNQIQREQATGKEPNLQYDNEALNIAKRRAQEGFTNDPVMQLGKLIANPNRAYESMHTYNADLDHARRVNSWNQWAKSKETELAQQAKTNPQVMTALQQLQERMKQNQTTTEQNWLINLHDRKLHIPGVSEGNWHYPWQNPD